MEITAAVMEKADGVVTRRNIKLEKVELEGPRKDEVLIKVTSCGVCGTDKGCIHGLEPYPTPGVLGHEGAGVVEAIGSPRHAGQARRPSDDRRPLLRPLPHLPEGRAPLLRELLGPDLLRLSHRRVEPDERGTARRSPVGSSSNPPGPPHTLALERQLAKVPEGLDLDLTGPYGCSISTGAGTILNELRPYPGSSIAIFGAGNVGLAAVMAARMTGATTIIAIDEVPERLALARELGATHTLEHGTGRWPS